MSAPATRWLPLDLSGGIPAPTLANLGRGNLARLANGYLALLGTLARESKGDNELRAFVVARLAEVDEAIGGEAAEADAA